MGIFLLVLLTLFSFSNHISTAASELDFENYLFNPVLDNLILSLQYPNGQTRKTCHQAIERLVCMPEQILTYEILEEFIIPILLDLCAVDRIADEMKSDSLSCLQKTLNFSFEQKILLLFCLFFAHVF